MLPLRKMVLAVSARAAVIAKTTRNRMGRQRIHRVFDQSERKRQSGPNPTAGDDPIRNKPLVQTTGADLLAVIHANGNCVAHYLRRLHNLALDLGWLPWPILAKRAWPKIRSQSKRAITAEEHAAIIASEQNRECRAFYELLYETGAAQTDAANLTVEDIDWQNGVLVYRRKKLGPLSEPCRLTIGKKLRTLFHVLPSSGDLFPNIKRTSANHRSAEFRRRCRVTGIAGVSLHSYRHAWAQRAKSCGYPQRFAQEALGHGSRAVHEAYARGAVVICPALEEYESASAEKLIRLSAAYTNSRKAKRAVFSCSNKLDTR